MPRSDEPRRSSVVGAIARQLSVDNRRDRDPNVPIRSANCRLSVNPSEGLFKIRQTDFRYCVNNSRRR